MLIDQMAVNLCITNSSICVCYNYWLQVKFISAVRTCVFHSMQVYIGGGMHKSSEVFLVKEIGLLIRCKANSGIVGVVCSPLKGGYSPVLESLVKIPDKDACETVW